MTWLVALAGALFNSLFSAVGNWFAAAQAHADAVAVGQQTQAAADQKQQTVQAAADETKVADVVQAENASLAKSVADPSSLRSDADPDSRD